MWQHAHRIKGAAGNMGMRGMQDTCELLEFNTREGAAGAAAGVGTAHGRAGQAPAHGHTREHLPAAPCSGSVSVDRMVTEARHATLVHRCLEVGHDGRFTDGAPAPAL